MKYPSATILLAVTLSWIPACAPKVDCKQLKTKLDKCATELVWAIKPSEKANFEKNPQTAKSGKTLAATVEKLRKELDKNVYGPCKQHRGRAKDAKQVSKCVEKKSCEAFAQCFAKYLRSKTSKK